MPKVMVGAGWAPAPFASSQLCGEPQCKCPKRRACSCVPWPTLSHIPLWHLTLANGDRHWRDMLGSSRQWALWLPPFHLPQVLRHNGRRAPCRTSQEESGTHARPGCCLFLNLLCVPRYPRFIYFPAGELGIFFLLFLLLLLFIWPSLSVSRAHGGSCASWVLLEVALGPLVVKRGRPWLIAQNRKRCVAVTPGCSALPGSPAGLKETWRAQTGGLMLHWAGEVVGWGEGGHW